MRIGFWLAFCVVILAGCGSSEPTAQKYGGKPHIIVVSIDTIRADKISVYGGPEGLTPNIDAIADGGVQFAHAVAPIATTFPSHASMFTGLYPRYHGVRWNGHALDDKFVTVAEQLKAQGYQSAAVAAYRAMLSRGGLHQGFDVISDPVSVEAPKPAVRKGDGIVRWVQEYLDSDFDDDKPLMLWAHFFEPHAPYVPSEYSRARMQGYTGFAEDGITPKELNELAGSEIHGDPKEMAAMHALYEGEVKRTDAFFAELMATLDDHDILDNAVVIVVGDHAQGMGEEKRFGHGPVVWDSILSVPFMIKDFREDRASHVVETPVSVVDLGPTLIDLAQAESLPNAQGRSLISALAGFKIAPAVVYAEVRQPKTDLRESTEEISWSYDQDTIAVIDPPFKIIRRNDKSRLYDHSISRLEAQSVSKKDNPGVAEALEGLADNFLEGGFEGTDVELDESAIEELKSLGYIQ